MLDADSEKLALFVEEVERWQVRIDPIESIFEYNLPAHMPINILDGLAGAKAGVFLVQHDGLDASIMRRLQRRKRYEVGVLTLWQITWDEFHHA